jgi:hypothetical protein
MSISIKRVENGFIVEWQEKEDDDCFVSRKFIFEDKNSTENDDGEIEALQEALLEVKEQLGYFNSKHKKKNLIIKIEEQEINEGWKDE